MKKLLSSLLVLTLTLSCCAPCFASNNDESDQVKTRSYKQEKEIDMCSEELKKQLDKINELKSMSKDSYYWYRCKQILNSLLKFAFKCGAAISSVYLCFFIGYNSGFETGRGLADSFKFFGFSQNSGANYEQGYIRAYAKREEFVKKFIKVGYRKVHPDQVNGPGKKVAEEFTKLLNNLDECMRNGDCNLNNLK